jgi:hypothetical protein
MAQYLQNLGGPVFSGAAAAPESGTERLLSPELGDGHLPGGVRFSTPDPTDYWIPEAKGGCSKQCQIELDIAHLLEDCTKSHYGPRRSEEEATLDVRGRQHGAALVGSQLGVRPPRQFGVGPLDRFFDPVGLNGTTISEQELAMGALPRNERVLVRADGTFAGGGQFGGAADLLSRGLRADIDRLPGWEKPARDVPSPGSPGPLLSWDEMDRILTEARRDPRTTSMFGTTTSYNPPGREWFGYPMLKPESAGVILGRYGVFNTRETDGYLRIYAASASSAAGLDLRECVASPYTAWPSPKAQRYKLVVASWIGDDALSKSTQWNGWFESGGMTLIENRVPPKDFTDSVRKVADKLHSIYAAAGIGLPVPWVETDTLWAVEDRRLYPDGDEVYLIVSSKYKGEKSRKQVRALAIQAQLAGLALREGRLETSCYHRVDHFSATVYLPQGQEAPFDAMAGDETPGFASLDNAHPERLYNAGARWGIQQLTASLAAQVETLRGDRASIQGAVQQLQRGTMPTMAPTVSQEEAAGDLNIALQQVADREKVIRNLEKEVEETRARVTQEAEKVSGLEARQATLLRDYQVTQGFCLSGVLD